MSSPETISQPPSLFFWYFLLTNTVPPFWVWEKRRGGGREHEKRRGGGREHDIKQETLSGVYMLNSATHCDTLQHTSTHCSTQQHTTAYCNILQNTATHCNRLRYWTQTQYTWIGVCDSFCIPQLQFVRAWQRHVYTYALAHAQARTYSVSWCRWGVSIIENNYQIKSGQNILRICVLHGKCTRGKRKVLGCAISLYLCR